MVSICISLMVNYISFHVLFGHLFIFLREMSSGIPLCFCLPFLLLSCKSSLYILDTCILLNINLQMFSLILWVVFPLPEGTICSTHIFNFYEVQYIFLFCPMCFCVISKKGLLNLRPRSFIPIISSKSFISIVSALTFRSVIRF